MKSSVKDVLFKVQKLVLMLLLLAMLGSCEDLNCIKGDGQVETRTLALQPFTNIEVNGDFKVYLTQGATQKVEVIGEANILDQLETDVSDQSWLISHTGCVRRSKAVEVRITMPEVNAMYLNGSGFIKGEGVITAAELPVTVNGSGKIDLQVNASKVISQVIGSGEMLLRGKTATHSVSISGSGKTKAFDLQANNVNVNLSGSGVAEVAAANLLGVDLSGSGMVYYKGNPTVNQQVSGSGKVVKR